MSKTLKIGFIGGAINSSVGYAHFTSCRMDMRWKLTAGCFSRNTDENDRTAEAYGILSGHKYTDWRQMIKNEKQNIDAVAILTPTTTHFEITNECLKADIPVICEKALATSCDEADKLLDSINETKGFLAVVYNYSGYPMVRELRNMIRRGELGEIQQLHIEMPQEGYIRPSEDSGNPHVQPWRLNDGKIPSVYLDLGSHIHHMIYYLTDDKPLEVVAVHSSNGMFKDVIDNVSCICKLSNNIQGQIWFGKSALGYKNGLRIRIFGSKGAVEWTQVCPEELTLAYQDGTRRIIDRGSSGIVIAGHKRYNRFKAGHPGGFIEALANLYYDIADELIAYRSNNETSSNEVFGAELACEGLRFLEKAATSAASYKWEKV